MLAEMPYPVKAVQIDGGSEFMADFEQACADKTLTLYVLPPRSPKLNGGVEKCNQTWRYAFYGCVELPTSINDIARAVDRFQHKYNDLGPHGALAYDTPNRILLRPPSHGDILVSYVLSQDMRATRIEGRGKMSHLLPLRVYYEDTDFSGVVYHASYLRFLERGRTEFIRDLGIDQAALHRDTGFAFVVRRMTIDWIRPALMDDVVTVETAPSRLKGASVVLAQRILRGEAVLLTADVLVAATERGRASRLPKALWERLGAVPAAL